MQKKELHEVVLPNGVVYRGQISPGNKVNGRGYCTFGSDDSYYIGDWQDHAMHGKGLYRYTDGTVYEGEWVKNQREGRGVLIYACGNHYEGEFKADKKEGRGLFTFFNSGAVYHGEFKDNNFNGDGVFRYPNGDTYEGKFVDDKKHGHGIYRYSDGDMFEGEYKDGSRNGFGYFKWGDGVPDIFVGEWKDGERSGKGLLKLVDGSVLEAQYENDERKGPARFVSSNQAIWVGEFYSHNVSDGVMTFENGDTLIGEWEGYNFKNGRKLMIMRHYSTGELILGHWVNGEFIAFEASPATPGRVSSPLAAIDNVVKTKAANCTCQA